MYICQIAREILFLTRQDMHKYIKNESLIIIVRFFLHNPFELKVLPAFLSVTRKVCNNQGWLSPVLNY